MITQLVLSLWNMVTVQTMYGDWSQLLNKVHIFCLTGDWICTSLTVLVDVIGLLVVVQ